MATRTTSDGTRTTERLTNEGTPGYYSGNPLIKQRDLTPEEAQSLAAEDAAIAQIANESTLRTRADAALADLDQIINSTGTLSTANLSVGLRTVARVLKAMLRLYLRRLDATD